jgi:L-glutamine-phosphate cytidylyltransferase
MKVIILAAGTGSRLRPLSDNKPKCLVKIRGKPILLHQLDMLNASGLTEVEIITGYEGQQISSAVAERATCYEYPAFAETNNLHTLNHCGNLLRGDVIIMFADVLLGAGALKKLLKADGDFSLLVDISQCLTDTMRIKLNDGMIIDIGGHIDPADGDGNFVGIAKYSATGSEGLRKELSKMVAGGGFESSYYTQALPRLAKSSSNILPVPIGNVPWIEIDTIREYEKATAADFYLMNPLQVI